MTEKVAITVLNYNTYEYTIECVKTLLEQSYKNYTIFIVENGSKNDSKKKILEFLDKSNLDYLYLDDDLLGCTNLFESLPNIVYIQSSENLGYAKGNNLAIKLAYNLKIYSYFWILNNDTAIPKETLNKMVCTANEDLYDRPIGNYLYYYDNKSVMQMPGGLGITKYTFKPYHPTSKEDIKYLSGASFFISKNFIKENGFMPEDYFLNSEDLDYFYAYYRTFKKKYSDVSPFNIVGKIYHKESATQGKKSTIQTYYYHRNLLYSNQKFKDVPNIILLAIFLIRIIKWLFIDFKLSLSILMAIKDYYQNLKGIQQYNFM